ncbi:methyltransferase domain-containing protein [Dactylosporangium fulvum]|uniref:Methyltransferase domain-containing protein n=1 Tax=Dactylosporangium fulvum TaxID=53359 RepID=A0ABY5W2E6_9ACTN|nr:methyltransferase domain-containing protein [Dactylosporangium fulvum]UWP83219.1 methyltransferase domain-containing protein [Dactylosporangium fulvum]
MTAARLVARVVRGIERVLADEVQVGKLGRVTAVEHREVWFEADRPGPAVLDLRCADDVFLVGTTAAGIGRARADLQMLGKAAAAMPVRHLLDQRRLCGGAPAAARSVDVSASFLGRRNFTRYDIEDAVGEPVAAALGLPYHSRRTGAAPPPGGLSWRVTLVDDRALVALRIADRPLHRRAYRQWSRPGSLHPPVAAAMLRLAGRRPGEILLDPCCGVGTIVLEASGPALGGDIDPSAVDAARRNAAGRPETPGIAWVVGDAGRLPLPDGAVDLVVTNPPWDRQVPFGGSLARRPQLFWTQVRRVLRPGGRAVVLTTDAGAALASGLSHVDSVPISLAGQHPRIVVLRN